MALSESDARRLPDLQRRLYLAARQRVERDLAEILAGYDRLAEELDPVRRRLLLAVEAGDWQRAQRVIRDLERRARAGLAELADQNVRQILGSVTRAAVAGALSVEIARTLAESPGTRLADVVDLASLRPKPPYNVSLGIAFDVGEEVRESILRHVYRDGLSLSRRLHVRLEQRRAELERILVEGVSVGRNTLTVAEQIARLDITDPRFPRYLQRLVDATRGTSEAVRARALASAIREAAERKRGPLGIGDAVQRLVRAAQRGNLRAMDEAVTAFLERKARYHAVVIARTEATRAYFEGARVRALANPWVTAMAYRLSPRHPRRDVCDTYAEQDLYGLGPGIYPVEEAPMPPHPQCLCVLLPVADAAAVPGLEAAA